MFRQISLHSFLDALASSTFFPSASPFLSGALKWCLATSMSVLALVTEAGCITVQSRVEHVVTVVQKCSGASYSCFNRAPPVFALRLRPRRCVRVGRWAQRRHSAARERRRHLPER